MVRRRDMANVLSEKRQQVIATGRLGWSLRRIQAAVDVRRETASAYLPLKFRLHPRGRAGKARQPVTGRREPAALGTPPGCQDQAGAIATYFVTELLQGESLRERLSKGPIPLGFPSWSPTSYKATTFGWFKEAASLASRSKALQQRPVAAAGLGHDLDANVPPEPGVLGPGHLGHAARSQESHHLVRASRVPGVRRTARA
jgi:hypothetical protein